MREDTAASVQILASEEETVLFWVEDGTIRRKWTSGDRSLSPALETIMFDLQLAFAAIAGEVDRLKKNDRPAR